MDARVKTFIAYAGVLLEIGPYAALLLGILNDPLYLMISLIAGVLTLMWISIVAWRPVQVEGQTVTSSGDPQVFTRLGTSLGHRIALGAAFLVALAWLILVVVCEGRRIFDPAIVSRPLPLGASSPMLDITDDDFQRFESEAGAIVHSKVQQTHTVDLQQLSALELQNLIFQGGGYLFTIARRPRIPWIQIDEIRVVVEKHWKDGFPSLFYKTARSSGDWQSTVFVAELEPPDQDGEERICLAKCLYPQHPMLSGKGPLPVSQIPVINHEEPFPISLLLTSEEPGLYQYRVEVVLSCLGKEKCLDVAPSTLCVVVRPILGDDPLIMYPEESVPATVIPGPKTQ